MFKRVVKGLRYWWGPMAMVAAVLLLPELARAGGTGGPLEDVYGNLLTWAQGSVGKTISMAMILVGLIAGVGKGSLMGFATGIGAGVGLYNIDNMISAVFTATLRPDMFL